MVMDLWEVQVAEDRRSICFPSVFTSREETTAREEAAAAAVESGIIKRNIYTPAAYQPANVEKY